MLIQFLSWEAAYRIHILGENHDLKLLPVMLKNVMGLYRRNPFRQKNTAYEQEILSHFICQVAYHKPEMTGL